MNFYTGLSNKKLSFEAVYNLLSPYISRLLH